MKIEELVIIVFFLGVSGYAGYYFYNLSKIKKEILNQINDDNIPAYQSYRKTIKIHSNINGLKSFSKASEFINLEKLLKDNKINIRLYLAIPSLLVGLGVLGTFIGFSMTVWSINDLIDSTNQTTAMKNLFSSVKIAFASSVAGMLWSFIFSKYEKIIFHNLEEEINICCNQLDELYYQSHDEYMREFVSNIQQNLTTDINKAFTDNINNSFNLINQNLKLKITELLKEPIEALEKQSKILEVQLTTWETSLNKQNKIVIASNEQIAALPKTIKNQINTITAAFGVLDEDIHITVERLAMANSEVDNYIQKWISAIQSQNTALKQQEIAIKNITLLFSNAPNLTLELEKINKTLEKTVKSFEKTEKILTSSIGNLSVSVNQAISCIPQLNQSTKNIEFLVQNFNEDINTEHQELKILIDTLEKSIKIVFGGLDSTIEQRMTKTTNLLNNYFSEIDKLSEKIVNTYTALNNGQKH